MENFFFKFPFTYICSRPSANMDYLQIYRVFEDICRSFYTNCVFSDHIYIYLLIVWQILNNLLIYIDVSKDKKNMCKSAQFIYIIFLTYLYLIIRLHALNITRKLLLILQYEHRLEHHKPSTNFRSNMIFK